MSKKKGKVTLKNKYKQDHSEKDYGGNVGQRVLDLSDYEEVNFYKMKEKENELDIIPFLVTSDKHPKSKANGGELIPNEDYDYVLDVYVHKFIGTGGHNFLCMKENYGKKCFICDELERLVSTDSIDEDQEKALKPKRRVFYNVINPDEEDKGIQILETSHFEFQKPLIELAENPGRRFKGNKNEDGFVTFAEPEEGYTVGFMGSERTYNKRKSIKPGNFAFYERDPYEDDIVEEAFPLDAMLVIPDYDKVKKIMLELDEEDIEENNEVEEEEETPKKRKLRNIKRKKREKTEEEPEEEDQEDDDEEEEKFKSSKNRQSRKPSKGRCPHGFKFGEDCEKHEECDECKEWDDCADEKDKLSKEE